jgi:hypothetical protein
MIVKGEKEERRKVLFVAVIFDVLEAEGVDGTNGGILVHKNVSRPEVLEEYLHLALRRHDFLVSML